MNYGEAIEKAWKIIWRFKILWVLGLLASCAGGGITIPSFNYQFSAADFPNLGRGNFLPPQVVNWFQSIPAWVWILGILVILALGILFFMVGLVGRIGVKRGAWRADEGAAGLAFGDLFKESLGYFWRMLGLSLLVGLPGFLFAIISLVFFLGSIFSIFASRTANAGILLLCVAVPLFCLIIPLSWIMTILSEMSSSALVAENLGIIVSLKRGWNLMWKKLGSVILISLLMFVIQIAAAILLGIPAILVAIPLAGGAFLAGSGLAIWIVAGVVFVLLLAIGLFINSLVQAYSGSLWMLTFRRLAPAPAVPVVLAPPSQDFPPAP
ncbi:MAG TPA: hypothetical protein VF313_02360 [Anaerolineaceae bacterium]